MCIGYVASKQSVQTGGQLYRHFDCNQDCTADASQPYCIRLVARASGNTYRVQGYLDIAEEGGDGGGSLFLSSRGTRGRRHEHMRSSPANGLANDLALEPSFLHDSASMSAFSSTMPLSDQDSTSALIFY